MAVEADFELYAGEDKTLTVTVTGVNITGWTIELRVSKGEGMADLITKSVGSGITITDGAGGVMTIALLAADTSSLEPRQYSYEIVRTTSGSVTVLTYGKLTLLGRP